MQRFDVETTDRTAIVDVTDRVADAIPPGTTGTCTAFVAHATAALVVNEAEDRLLGDLETFLDGLVAEEGWNHDRIDDNAAAHLRASLLGPSVTVPVEDGRLATGTWQSVLLAEFDGPRAREVVVTTATE